MRKTVFALFLLFSARPCSRKRRPKDSGRDMTVSGAMCPAIAPLAEATPEEKFALASRPGCAPQRSLMHIALANLYLLSVTGPKMPADMKEGLENRHLENDVISWLKRSLDAVKSAHLAVTPKDLERKVHIADRDATVDGMYLRIIVHANEHMGQLIAYAA